MISSFNKNLRNLLTSLQVSGGMNTSTYSSSAASLSQSSPKPTTDSASDLSAVAASLTPPTHAHHSTTAHHDSLMPAAPTATFGNTTVGGEYDQLEKYRGHSRSVEAKTPKLLILQAAAASMDWTVALQRHSAASQQMSFAAAASAHAGAHPGFAAHAAAGMYGWY